MGEILLYNIFSPIVDTCLSCEDIPDKVVRLCPDGDFLPTVFPASRMLHISDMHSKFALRPHHVSKSNYGRIHLQPLRLGEKKDRRWKSQGTNIMSAYATQGGHK